MLKFISILTINFSLISHAFALTYFQDFNQKGKPEDTKHIKWSYTDQLHPTTWEELIPGNGYAHLTRCQ